MMTRQEQLRRGYVDRRQPLYAGSFVISKSRKAAAIDKLKAVVLECTQSVKKRILGVKCR